MFKDFKWWELFIQVYQVFHKEDRTLFDNSSEEANLGKHSKVKKWINKKDIK